MINKTTILRIQPIIFLMLLAVTVLSACTNSGKTPKDDPLKNTKKLVKEGHVSLYNNGAINVPNTNIMLIPAGPDAVSFALELSGFRAKESLLRSLVNARDAVYLVADGTRKSFKVADNVIKSTDNVANYITDYSRENAKLLVYRAYPTTKHIIGETVQFSKQTNSQIKSFADSIRNESNDYIDQANKRQKKYISFSIDSVTFAKNAVTESTKNLGKNVNKAGDIFIKGYIAIPEKWRNRARQKQALNLPFKESWQKSLKTRKELSEHFTEIFADSSRNYADNISSSLTKSRQALDNASDTGVGLAGLESMRWLLQALFWDATIAPISKLGYASMGYITSNAIVFPVMVIASESGAATKVAVEVVSDTGEKTIDIIAPTFEAALAGTYAISSFALNSVGGVALGTTGAVGSGALSTVDSLSALAIQTTGNVAGYSVEYIGVPLSTAGIAIAGSTTGVVVGSAKAVTGSTLYIGGEVSSTTTKALGRTGAGAVVIAGTTASVVSGTGIGVYELAKAVAVPTSYQLGSGVVLGYSSMSHIAAHTILAASDAAYLVISLEGPKWVIYAVKGNIDNGETLVAGTVLNLNEMKNAGEQFSVLPASQKTLQSVARDMQEDLPAKTEP